MPTESDDWYQITISDPYGLSGDSVYSFVEPLIRELKIKYIRVGDIEGAVTGFKDSHDLTCFDAEEFLKRVRQATQYDWAYFYLYQEDSYSVKEPKPSYENLVRDAKASIRLADDTYFYIYTLDQKLADDLCHKFANAECRRTVFGGLEFIS